MDYTTKKFNLKKFLIFIFFLALLLVLVFFITEKWQGKKYVKVAFLDVGQGDAIYIEAPNKKQILIDGGRDQKVLHALSDVMPFADRSIDILLGTHPDADHIGGLYYVLQNYKVSTIFEPGAKSESKIYQSFQNEITDQKIPHIVARRGTDIVLDAKNNVVLHILYPDQNPIGWDTNDTSIVIMLSYGDEKVLLTGDSPIEKELYLVKKDGENLKADILKIGHHGSRTSSAKKFLEAVDPELAIISAGANNSYGHPHPEVISLLNKLGIEYIETSKEGTILCKLTKVDFECK